MRRPKRGPLRLLRESAQIKTLLILFCTMVVACLTTYIVIFFSAHGQVYRLSSQLIRDRAGYFLDMLSHTDLTLEEMVSRYQQGMGDIRLLDSFDKLPPMRGVIVEGDMEDGVVYFSAQRDLPFGVVRIRGKYLVIPPFIYEWEADTVRKLVINTLLLCALIASVCTVAAIHTSFRPLREIDDAISRVAHGDFSVRVETRSRDEIGKIARNFNWMIGELGRIEYLRQDFVSNVSHEFKTPLAAVQGSARLLASIPREKLTDAKLKKYTSLILEETARMTNLSSNLLRLSKLEHQSAAENITVFSLDEQIRRAILFQEAGWSAKRLELDIRLEPVDCQGDEDLLFQVWTNLLSNAVKFSREGGILLAGLTAKDGMAEIKLGDDGKGMNGETLQRLFEKFYQGDTSHSTEGSGLGLSIVKRIIDLHGGEISYQSAPGQGTLCTVLLPLRQQNEIPAPSRRGQEES